MGCNFTYYNITTGQEYYPKDNPVLKKNIDRLDKEFMIQSIKLVMKINGWSENDKLEIYSGCCISGEDNPYVYENGALSREYNDNTDILYEDSKINDY